MLQYLHAKDQGKTLLIIFVKDQNLEKNVTRV
jgi:hypothetical protein